MVNGAAACLLVALPFILRKLAGSRTEEAGADYTPE